MKIDVYPSPTHVDFYNIVFMNVSYEDQDMYFSEFWNGLDLYQTKLHWIHVMPYAGWQLEMAFFIIISTFFFCCFLSYDLIYFI